MIAPEMVSLVRDLFKSSEDLMHFVKKVDFDIFRFLFLVCAMVHNLCQKNLIQNMTLINVAFENVRISEARNSNPCESTPSSRF